MVPVSLYDTIEFEVTSDGSLRLECVNALLADRDTRGGFLQDLPAGEDNLVWRAVAALRDEAGVNLGARIRLVKRIPLQAGMGGGSSDAAAALCLANEAWRVGWTVERLMEMAARFGSDIPFFLTVGPAICSGRGERVAPVAMPLGTPLVIGHPGVGLPTGEVYRHVRVPREARDVRSWLRQWGQRPLAEQIQGAWNRLERSAVELEPRVARLRDRICRMTGWPAMVTGSGAACFGLCRTWRQAGGVARRLRAEGWPFAIAAKTVA